MLTRREFLSLAAVARLPQLVDVPVALIFDADAKLTDWEVRRFWALWAEAVADFGWCGVRFVTHEQAGGIERRVNVQPYFKGLQHGYLNVIVTNTIPSEWDKGRMLRGVTTLYRSFHLCLIAVDRAGSDRVPFLSVNTCVHELLHAVMLDIFELRPEGVHGQSREFRIDWLATRLGFFHSGAAVRDSARVYVDRLRAAGAP